MSSHAPSRSSGLTASEESHVTRAQTHFHGARASTACSSTACGLITPSTPRPLSRRRLPRPPLGFSLHAPQTYTSRASHALHRWTHLQRRRNPYRAFTPRPVAQQPDSAPQPSAPQPVARTTANRSRSRTAAPQPSAQQPAAQPHVLPRPPRTTFQSSCDLVNHHKHRRSRRSDIMLTLARRTLSPYLGLRRRGGVGPGGFTLVPPPETSDIREVTAVTCGITALAFPIRYGWVS